MLKIHEREAPTKHTSRFVGPRLPEDCWLWDGEICFDVPVFNDRAMEFREMGYWFPASYSDKSLVLAHHWMVMVSKKRPHQPRVVAHVASPGGKTRTFSLEQVLTGAKEGQCSDHLSGWTGDNRRSNLAARNASENGRNQKKQAKCRSKYAGVSYNGGKPIAYSTTSRREGRKHVHLGYFDSEEEAAKARDAYVREQYGPLARYNFPREGERPAMFLPYPEFVWGRSEPPCRRLSEAEKVWVAVTYNPGAGWGKPASGKSGLGSRFPDLRHTSGAKSSAARATTSQK